ncbi:Uncharacterised protein [Mycobacteroides abscessus subsp. abscessus]|nr:Uncharacterised protein [Mycobacteroides abscessus subsp. abscessus]
MSLRSIRTSPRRTVQAHALHAPSRHEYGASMPRASSTSSSGVFLGHSTVTRVPSSSTVAWAASAPPCGITMSANGSPASDW